MAETWTILKILNWTQEYFQKKGLPQARLDAEILLAFSLRLKRMDLYLQFERPLTSEELATYKALIKRRAEREPIAYITGVKEFWSRPFTVTKDVLIPRPETELIVEKAQEPKKDFRRILDIGTGSGILAVTLALEYPQAGVTAIDASAAAVEVASLNAQKLGTANIRFLPLGLDEFAKTDHGGFDLIVSNPPYIASAEIPTLMADVGRYEPALALDGGETGLDFYPQIARLAKEKLTPQGLLLVEIGETQGEAVKNIFEQAGFQDVGIIQDYSGSDRVVTAAEIKN